MKFFKGKKTYIGITIGIIYSIGIFFGIVPSNELVWTAIAGWTGIAFRMAVRNK